ncbi:MAG: phospholipase D family protein, partial [Desulfovibrio sp.]|nr:phospholipase D family protein [Desulfovibrio sp.]
MRPLLSLILLLALVLPAQAYDLMLRAAPASVYFSPRGGAQDALVQRIEQARESIYVLAY